MLYYHNPRCSKSRKGLEYLESKGIQEGVGFRVKEYLKDGVEEKEFLDLIKYTGLAPLDGLIRTKEALFKDLGLAGKDLSDLEWARIVHENPKLLERPIFVNDEKKAAIGRPDAHNFDSII